MNEIVLFQKKKQTGGLEPPPPGIFPFFNFTHGNPRQNKAPPLEIPQNFVDNLEFQGQKPRPMEISHHFFFTSFLINPSLIPLEIPFLNDPSLPPSVWFFSGKKPIPYLLIP